MVRIPIIRSRQFRSKLKCVRHIFGRIGASRGLFSRHRETIASVGRLRPELAWARLGCQLFWRALKSGGGIGLYFPSGIARNFDEIGFAELGLVQPAPSDAVEAMFEVSSMPSQSDPGPCHSAPPRRTMPVEPDPDQFRAL